MSAIAAGELNRLLQFQRRLETLDDLNQPVLGNWENFVQRWGNIRTPSGMGSIAPVDGVPRALNHYSIRTRFLNDGSIGVGMRIVHNGTIFDIKQIKHDFDSREWTDYVCEVGGNND